MNPVKPSAIRCGITAHRITDAHHRSVKRLIDNLCNHVKDEFSNERCPCCRRTMRFNGFGDGETPLDAATRGHVGNQYSPHDRRDWFFQCWECNNNQGHLSLFAWARKLVQEGDPRDIQVAKLAVSVRGWMTKKGRSYFE